MGGTLGIDAGALCTQGRRRMVASLRNVDDVATSELTRRVYRAMLTQGLRPSAGLRQAQGEMRE
jgi:CHAT domain-containing protein